MSTMTFEELAEDVETYAEEFISDVWAEVDRIAGMLNGIQNGLVNKAKEFLDFLTPDWLFFDLDEIENAIRKWNEEILPAIREAVGDLADGLGEALEQVFGNPIRLIEMAGDMADAGADLYQSDTLAQRLLALDGAWDGPAYNAYAEAAKEQNDAYPTLAAALEEGSTLTAAAAAQILELWRQLLREYQQAGIDAIDILAQATSAEKIVSFEVPVIISAIGKLVARIVAVAHLLLAYMTGQVAPRNAWDRANNGTRGLPHNKWPTVIESVSDTVNDPNQWTPAP